jgi:broad specificity phosphatase PhoE
MPLLLFISHPQVVVDHAVPVTQWSLSELGRTRMQHFAKRLTAHDVRSVWSSGERKASEAAGILGESLGVEVQTCAALGENDRSATGYLPPAQFEATANKFFAEPERSVDGWERAVDAQSRIQRAIEHVIARSAVASDIAVVSHGAVGTLLLCQLLGAPISRAHDQPSQGHWFAFDIASRHLLHGWRPLE